jgi:hypothetical protein
MRWATNRLAANGFHGQIAIMQEVANIGLMQITTSPLAMATSRETSSLAHSSSPPYSGGSIESGPGIFAHGADPQV